MSAPRSSRFSPHLVTPERLAALFVGRWPVVERLVEDTLSVAAAGGARYEVVVAPRGAGKSHTFALVAARLRERGAATGLRVLQLAEEEYPASLVDLLSRFLLAAPPVEGLPTPEAHVGVLRRAAPSERIATAVGLLEARAGDGPLVLLAENLDRVFEALGREGQQQLRSILSAHPRWSVVATSCTYGPDFTDGRAPFYKTFARVALPALTDDQAVEMLKRLAREHEDNKLLEQLTAPEGPVRVRAIRYLVGDNPRAMAILFPFLRDGRLDDLEGVFLDLAEELTPYFQDQMSRIPAGQRPYLELLAGSWRPQTVGELADATFATPQTTSGQLRYLKRDGLVTAMQVGREVYYELAEPLHRLASAMKHPERAPLTLARFLVAWLPSERVRIGWEEAGKREGDVWDLALRLGGEEPSDYEKGVVHEVDRLTAAGDPTGAWSLAREGWDRTHGAQVGARLYGLAAGRGTPEEAEILATEIVEQCPGAGWIVVLFGTLFAGRPASQIIQAECRRRLREAFALEPDGLSAAAVLLVESPKDELWLRARQRLAAEPPEFPLSRVIPALVDAGHTNLAVDLGDRWGVARIDEDSFRSLLPSLEAERRLGEAFSQLVEVLVSAVQPEEHVARRAYSLVFRDLSLLRITEARERLRREPRSPVGGLLAGLLAYEVGDLADALERLARLDLGRFPWAAEWVATVGVAGGRWDLVQEVARSASEPARREMEWCVEVAATGRTTAPRPSFEAAPLLLHGLATWVVASAGDEVAVHHAMESHRGWQEFVNFAWLVRDARTLEAGESLPPLRGPKVGRVHAALRSLPGSAAPYAALAAPERRTLRLLLRCAGAQKLLDALPAEAS